MRKKLIDMTGQRFGSWLVVRQDGNTPRGAAKWLAVCDCGTQKSIHGADLRTGKSKSCGCLMASLLSSRSKTHGATKTRIYNIWKCMRARCNNPDHPQRRDYGGRGISVCSDWDRFETFRDWAFENGYSEGLSIERIDVNQGYFPGNCTWADASVQSANRRFVEKRSDGTPWVRVADENGVPRNTFYWRKRIGWDAEVAAITPYKK